MNHDQQDFLRFLHDAVTHRWALHHGCIATHPHPAVLYVSQAAITFLANKTTMAPGPIGQQNPISARGWCTLKGAAIETNMGLWGLPVGPWTLCGNRVFLGLPHYIWLLTVDKDQWFGGSGSLKVNGTVTIHERCRDNTVISNRANVKSHNVHTKDMMAAMSLREFAQTVNHQWDKDHDAVAVEIEIHESLCELWLLNLQVKRWHVRVRTVLYGDTDNNVCMNQQSLLSQPRRRRNQSLRS